MSDALGRRFARTSETAGWAMQRVRHSRPVRSAGRWMRQRTRAKGGSPKPPLVDSGWWPRSVLTVGERSLPQCYHYRIRQKADLFRRAGIPYREIGLDDEREALAQLQLASLLIIYRLPRDRRTKALVAEADRLHVPVVFEVDDVVYDRDLVAGNPNLDTLPWSLRAATIKGAEDYAAMLDLTHAQLGSTPTLTAGLRSWNGKPAFLLENGIDDLMLEVAASLDPADKPAPEAPVAIYGSGSLAHDRDFEMAAGALATWLSRRPQARLRLVGSVTVPPALSGLGSQIEVLPQLPFPEYLRALGRSTVAIAPLTSDRFNDYKSHIRYLESALVGTPLIASPTVYADYVIDGRTAAIACDEGQWHEALERLTEPCLQREMAGAAREHVRQWELDQRPSAQLHAMLDDLVPEMAAV